MKTLFVICFFILGLVFGSFLNVIGLRVPKNESFTKGRSHCVHCFHPLSWYELIPLFSYIFLRGKCHHCHARISLFYPLQELFCGVLFAISYYSLGFTYELIVGLSLSAMLIMVIASDINYLIIPDSFTIVISVLIIISRLLSNGLSDTFVQILYGITGFMIMYLLMVISSAIFKKEALGGADVKLMFLVGLSLAPIYSQVTSQELLVGFLIFFLVIIIASFIALPTSLYLLVRNKEHVIPFGPFIVASLLIVFFTKITVSDVLEFLMKLPI